jgi:hypothetical protein
MAEGMPEMVEPITIRSSARFSLESARTTRYILI